MPRNSHLRIAFLLAAAALGATCISDTAVAGMGYWDLFCVNLTPNGLYWNQVSGGVAGGLTDPLVSPDPNGNPVFDNASPLGGTTYGFGGHDWGTGTLESTATGGNQLVLQNEPNYYLNVVLDSASSPHADKLFPSWGTVGRITVTPQFAAAPGAAIAPNWQIAPADPNSPPPANVVVVNPGPPVTSTVTLARSDFGVAEGATQNRTIFGAGAQLPTVIGGSNVTGYAVTFDTSLNTWDSYSLTGGGGGGGGYPITQYGAVTHPQNFLPTCKSVPGKEFSNNFDEDANGALDPLQNIAFDCQGSCKDTYDYSGSAWAGNPSPNDEDQVDAIANSNDAYYWPMAKDQVPLVVSFAPAAGGTVAAGDIMYQMAQAPDTTGTWCTAQQICPNKAKPDDVDGLELYGPPNVEAGVQGDDSNMFSLDGDPGTPNLPGGVAVWQYNAAMHASLPYISTAALKKAIGIGDDVDDPYPEQDIDLDALMVYESESEWESDYGFEFGPDYNNNGPPDSIMFSLEANKQNGGSFDGGELWIWTFGTPAQFLTHGGEVWDTPHDVAGHFGGSEEVNALEAVADIPEPATLALLSTAAMAFVVAGLIRRRRRESQMGLPE